MKSGGRKSVRTDVFSVAHSDGHVVLGIAPGAAAPASEEPLLRLVVDHAPAPLLLLPPRSSLCRFLAFAILKRTTEKSEISATEKDVWDLTKEKRSKNRGRAAIFAVFL